VRHAHFALLDYALVVRFIVQKVVIGRASIGLASTLRVYVNVAFWLVGTTKLRTVELVLSVLRVGLAFSRLALLTVDARHAGHFVLRAVETFGLVRNVEAWLRRAPFVQALSLDDVGHSRLLMFRAITALCLPRKIEAGKQYTTPVILAPLANHVLHRREPVFQAPSAAALAFEIKARLSQATFVLAPLGEDIYHLGCFVSHAIETLCLPWRIEERIPTASFVRAISVNNVDHNRRFVLRAIERSFFAGNVELRLPPATFVSAPLAEDIFHTRKLMRDTI
jgi:hypothetical protein